MNRYKILDEVGAEAISKKMEEMSDDGWTVFSPHILYIRNGEVHFTVMIHKWEEERKIKNP